MSMGDSATIPLSEPNVGQEEIEEVTRAISSGWVSTGGPRVKEFESKIAEYVNCNGAVACSSGTAGIHLALLVCHVGEGDEVLVPSVTFIAAVNPIRYVGAVPVFMDCCNLLTIDVAKLLRFCENQCTFNNGSLINRRTGRIVKAIVTVHVFGNICDMAAVMSIATRFNLRVIEDATEALGSYIAQGILAGKYAGTIGDIGVFSFNGNKIITTGSGGMLVSDSKALLEQALYLSTQAKDDAFNYRHDAVGYNYRMSEIQAAIGLAQLKKLDQIISIKQKNYEAYRHRIQNIKGVQLLQFRKGVRPNFWFYSVRIHGRCKDRCDVMKLLLAENIQVRPVWDLIPHQIPYRENEKYIDFVQNYVPQIFNIPCSATLSEVQIRRVCDVLERCLDA